MSTSPAPKVSLREIVGLLRGRNYRSGIELFRSAFSAKCLPTSDFMARCLEELNPQEFPEPSYELMLLVTDWTRQTREYEEKFEEIKRIFYDKLVTKASLSLQNAKQKAQSFAEHSQAADTLTRTKLEEENQRTIQELLDSTRMDFEKACGLLPDSVSAYYGLLRYYQQIENKEKVAETRQIIKKIETTGKCHDIVEIDIPELPAVEIPDIPSPPKLNPEYELQQIEALFNNHDDDSALTSIERLLIQEPDLLAAVQLKIRILTAKRQFHPAKAALRHAFKLDPSNQTTRNIQVDFLETKLKTLSRIAGIFLNKALKLGPSLGCDYFRRACKLLEQAVVIAPDDMALLDQLYTCYMYLGEEQRAAVIRRDIAQYNPNYVTTVARLKNSSLCFLAGYAYDEAPESLEPFRRVRRNLLRTPAGRHLVTWYVRLSPILVESSRRLHIPKALYRILLFPLLNAARRFAVTP